ncbi:TrmH family RNA methyltransferase [Maribacter algicola]|uniref:TrmH family RNA methyltransferase n=1 Tax=Meishania litoralis TaxID=3434685 RepID=A0ACC7LL34_9FLAO
MDDQRLLAYLEEFISPARIDRFSEVLKERTKYITVALEDVFQLHNTSAVIRSCEVFGIQEAHVIEARFGKRLDKNIAMGAQQWVDVHRYKNTKTCIQELRDSGYQIMATVPSISATPLDDFEIDRKTALFFGTEKEGLSDEVLRSSDGLLRIPMFGFTESLNISVSAAILLHQLSTKLRKTNLPWQLSESEKLKIRLDWTKKSIKSIDDILNRYRSVH